MKSPYVYSCHGQETLIGFLVEKPDEGTAANPQLRISRLLPDTVWVDLRQLTFIDP